MVTGGEDKKVNLWAVGKSSCIMSLSGHTSAVSCVKFGQCEDIVCAGSAGGALKIWDLDVAKILRTLLGHKGKVNCVDFHPYGDFVASGSSDSSIKLWDKRRKGSIFTYKGHNKAVNTLKFSPDGRWIASGCDDGIVKLWDLPAGKLRTDYKAHNTTVTDIEFHPNELLLASCSSDQYVKFWDLENHRIVCSSDGDSGPIQKIFFSPSGTCLFSGAQDILKVYAWEPIRTLDTLVMGWGQVSDIACSESQLIIGSYSLTNVSVYLMDLKKIEPEESWLKQTAALHSARSDSSCDDYPAEIDIDEAQIIGFGVPNGYLIQYEPIDGPTVCSDIDLSKTRVIGVDLSTFLPPLEDPPHLPAEAPHPFNCTYKVATVQGMTRLLALPTAVARPYNYEKDKVPDAPEDAEEKKVLPSVEKDAVLLPEAEQKGELEIVQPRSKGLGVEVDDFLPKDILENCRSGFSTLEISDAEAISSIYRGHDSMTQVLSHRKKYLISVIRVWRTEGAVAGLTAAVHMSDSAILVDLLTLLISKPSSWTLDICQLLLPVICDLLKSKYETYITVGCMSLKLIMRNFAHVIKINVAAPKGVGIDITREERYKKCRNCYNHLMALKSLVLHRHQAKDGQLSKLFSELYDMLQVFDR